MNAMRALDLDQITAIIAGATKPINVLWQTWCAAIADDRDHFS
jgi:hypothetical protein